MSQLGFFDVANRYAGLDAKNDPLLKIDSVVPWEDFRPHLEAVWRKPANQRKSSATEFVPFQLSTCHMISSHIPIE